MKTIKRIIISALATVILLGGVFTPPVVSATSTTFPSETNAFGTTVYIDTINKDAPFFDVVLPEIRKNIKENNKHSITPYYDALPLANNPENFQGLGHTTYANINGKTVTAEAFYRYHNESSNDPNNGLGLLIYQCIEYKRKHPKEDVKITFSSYRTSVSAAVCVLPESKYYGYMRSLFTTNYDEHGFVRISYMLTEAARMGIEVTLVNQLNSYAVRQYKPSTKKLTGRAPLDMKIYFSRALKSDCYNNYAQGKKVSDFMNCVNVDWTVADKTGDMQHIKSATVSNYLATDGTEHGPSLFVSSANLDENDYKGCNGNNGSQAGCIISDHDDLYRVTYNYMQLMAKYKGQEDIYKLRKYAKETNAKQIELIKSGREDEIPEDEQIVYLGSETDKVFEMYFSPFGSSMDTWDIVHNPFCKYMSKFAKSTDYVELYWNEFGFGSDYNCRMYEKLIEKAYCTKPNVKNKFSISITDFDSSGIEKLKLGRDIGARSIKDGTNIHSKDILMSYEEKGVRHNVSIVTSCNFYMNAFNYRTNSALVINETQETGGEYYKILSEKYSYGMVNNNLMIDTANLALKIGETFTLNPIYYGDKELTWSVEDGSIATVDNGKVTALKDGTTNIVLTDGEYSFKTKLTVSACLECIYSNAYRPNINEQYILSQKLPTSPLAFTAVISINKSDLKSKNTIIGCEDTFGAGFSFYINDKGNPCWSFKDKKGTGKAETVVLDYDVATGKKVHLCLSYVPDNAANRRINCYVDGAWKKEVRPAPEVTSFESEFNCIIGGDYLNGNATCFPGEIYSVALWSSGRNTKNNANEYANGIDVTDSNLMAGYDLTLCSNCMRNDLSLNDNHLEQVVLWQDKDKVEPVVDYDYSFAVIGDTQTMCEEDPAAMESIYDWLLANKESEKIEYVMGLGDITDDSTDVEWEHANNFISKLNGKIPYSLTRGNHDDWDDFNRNLHNGYYETTVDGMMNSGDIGLTDPNQPGVIETTLEDGSKSYITREEDEPEGGVVSGDLTNSYRYLSVGDVDYLILTLDFAPTEEMLSWVDSVVEAHPKHRVIITTHAYMYRDGTTISEGDCYAPSYYNGGGYENALNGDEMWEKCFSKHKNIVMVLSGHDPWQHIVYRQDKGVNGNLVTQMLIDPQYMDRNIGSTAMVAMLYFSNNSDTVTVRYYSVAKDCYGSVLSQFTVDLRERNIEDGDDFEGDVDDDYGDDIENGNGNNEGEDDGENNNDDDQNDGNTEDSEDETNTVIPQEPSVTEPQNSVLVTYPIDRYVGFIKPQSVSKTTTAPKTENVATNKSTVEKTTKIKFKVKTTKGSKTVTLKWNKVKGAKNYKIYKYNTKTKKFKYLKTTTKTTYKVSKLKTATTYKFLVKAFTKNGKSEVGSSKYCTVKTKPATPTLKAKLNNKRTVTISWSKASNVKGYQVYYSTSKNGKYKKLGTYTTTKKTVKFKTKKTYYIKVRSYYKTSGKATYSSFSKSKKVKIK